MPSLKQLIEELQELFDNPNEVRVPGQLYDDTVDQIVAVADQEEQDEEEPE